MFNRDCVIFNKEVFKFLQLYSETSSKFRSSSIFKFKTLTVDPESEWKPEKDKKGKTKKTRTGRKTNEEKKSKKSGDDKKTKRTKDEKKAPGMTKRKRAPKKED